MGSKASFVTTNSMLFVSTSADKLIVASVGVVGSTTTVPVVCSRLYPSGTLLIV